LGGIYALATIITTRAILGRYWGTYEPFQGAQARDQEGQEAGCPRAPQGDFHLTAMHLSSNRAKRNTAPRTKTPRGQGH
jgi:hypothetical protein